MNDLVNKLPILKEVTSIIVNPVYKSVKIFNGECKTIELDKLCNVIETTGGLNEPRAFNSQSLFELAEQIAYNSFDNSIRWMLYKDIIKNTKPLKSLKISRHLKKFEILSYLKNIYLKSIINSSSQFYFSKDMLVFFLKEFKKAKYNEYPFKIMSNGTIMGVKYNIIDGLKDKIICGNLKHCIVAYKDKMEYATQDKGKNTLHRFSVRLGRMIKSNDSFVIGRIRR